MTEKKQTVAKATIDLSDDQLDQAAGGVIKTGPGTLVLSGSQANTSTGGVNVAVGDVNGDGVAAMRCQNNLKQLGLG
jgi:autotransporter-associated beta strand protein